MFAFFILYVLPVVVCIAYTAAGMRHSLYNVPTLMRIESSRGGWFYRQGLCVFTGGLAFFPVANAAMAASLVLLVPFVWRTKSEYHDAFKKDKP